MMFDSIGLGRRIVSARGRRGVSQRELAEQVGVSAGYLSRVERGLVEGVPLKLILACAIELGESIDWIARGGSDDEQLISVFRALPEQQQRTVRDFAEYVRGKK